MLQFTPGSDVALLNSLMNVIVREKLFDEKYIKKHTIGFDQLTDHLKSFDPELMSSICGIDSEILYEVARIYGNAKNAIIFWGMGISQHTHGTDNARCLISLALMTGNVGRPGTGLHPLRGQNNVQGASDAGLIPMMYPDYNLVDKDEHKKFYEEFWNTKLDPEKGLTVVEIMESIYEKKIQGLYIKVIDKKEKFAI